MKYMNFNHLAKELKLPSRLLTKILIKYNILVEDNNSNLLPTDFAVENEYCFTILIDEYEEVIFTTWGFDFIVELLETQYCAVI